LEFLGNKVIDAKNNENKTIIAMSTFANGVYIVIIEDDKKIIEKSVILKVN